MRHLHDRPLSERLLYTAFLLLIGIGYLMALAYLYLSRRGHDGKPGLSMEDIVDNYYGNRSGTRIEAAISNRRTGIMSWRGCAPAHRKRTTPRVSARSSPRPACNTLESYW